MDNQIKLLSKDAHRKFIEQLVSDKQVYGPVQQGKRVGYQKIRAFDELTFDFIVPDMSVKAFVFPKVEKLFSYTKTKEEVVLQNIQPDAIPERVLVGVRPCDAAGMESLRAIFDWDPADPIFDARLKRTTIVSYACNTCDAYCFCTSIGGGPGNTKGSDILLTRMDSGDYIAEILTPKGEVLMNACRDLFQDGEAPDKEKYLANVPKRFDDTDLEGKMKQAFDTTIFDEYALRCLGCAACAYVCPTCACFDIQDEKRGSKGQRVRSWDSCGAKLFTLHTSGHNPRETQGARWRQRLMHKLSYMPERLEVRGCVGCGRCSRRCPVDMNIAESVAQICKQETSTR